MKILVTGSAGRIGRAICLRLRREHDVTGLDRLPSSTTDLVGDLCESALIRRALRGVDAVVHTAALHAPHVDSFGDDEFERINVQATGELIDAAAEAGVARFVFTSTTALYGRASTPAGRAGWLDENTTPQPVTRYHHSKLAAEALLEERAGRLGLAVTVLRMSRCFPEPAPLMAVYRLHRGIDARDVAEAHALALGRRAPGFRRYVVSGATPFRQADVTGLARDAPSVLSRRAPQLVDAFSARGWKLPATIDRVYSPGLAAAELGWRTRYGFDEVLRLLDEGSPEVLPTTDFN